MPPRTKACALCRHKRIKCDATLPNCLMCIRNGKQCPGPIDGPLIIDMTMQTVKRTKAKKKTKTKPKKGTKVVSEVPEPAPTAADLAVSPINQPSQTYAINQAFFSNFLTYFASTGEDKDLQNRMTWMHILPALSSDGTNTALTLALRATSLAYTGTEAQSLPVLQEACKLYGQALHTHARLIQAKPEEVTTHTISTSIMLSLFEAMLATSGDAYREHVYGAAKMFEVAGPNFCANGVLCQLFFHVRTQMAFVYLTTAKSKQISVKKILSETLQYKRLPVFQKLMSLIAKLAEIYVTNSHLNQRERIENLKTYLPVKSDITTMYQDYKARGAAKNNPVSWKDENGYTQYRDSFTAMVMSYFHAAHILMTVLSPRLGVNHAEYEDHCDPILESSRFLQAKRIGCSYMRMAMPLYLVALHGTYAEQRDEAVRIFYDWRTGGMAGLSYLALETIQKRREEEMLEKALPLSGPVLDPVLEVEYLPLPTRSGVIEIGS